MRRVKGTVMGTKGWGGVRTARGPSRWRGQFILQSLLSAFAFLRLVGSGLVANWQSDADRRVLWVPVLFGLGAIAYLVLPTEPSLWSLAGLPIALAGLVAARLWGWHAAALGFGVVCALSAGFGSALWRTHALSTAQLARPLNGAVLTGRVETVIRLSGTQYRLGLVVDGLQDRNGTQFRSPPTRVRVLIRSKTPPPQAGERVRLRADLTPLPRPVAPGAFDFGRSLWFQGYGATGFAFFAPEPIEAATRNAMGVEAAVWLARLRAHLSSQIEAGMSGPSGPVATALLTGERHAIGESTLQAFRDSSLAHLLSISGLHMVLAGVTIFAALRILLCLLPGLSERWPVKKFAAIAALVSCALYLAISGAAIPTQRAFLMIAFSFIAILLDRPALTMRLVSVAALLILFFMPESSLDASFQMSFAAVVALIAFHEWLSARGRDVWPGGVFTQGFKYFWGLALTSVIAGLATAPFAAFHFHRIAEYGVLANVLALPIVGTVVMPSGMLALALIPFGLEALPLAAMQWGLDIVRAIAVWVAALPGASTQTGAFPDLSLGILALGGLWLCLWQAPWRWLGFTAVPAAALLIWIAAPPPDIYVSEGGRQVGLRFPEGMALLDARRDRFESEAWLSLEAGTAAYKDAAKRGKAVFDCDSLGCGASLPGGDRLLVLDRADERAEDCARADVIIDRSGSRSPCYGPKLVLSARQLWQEGGAALRRNANGVWHAVTVEQVRGRRPWSRPNSAPVSGPGDQ